jgi:hypothetical protein
MGGEAGGAWAGRAAAALFLGRARPSCLLAPPQPNPHPKPTPTHQNPNSSTSRLRALLCRLCPGAPLQAHLCRHQRAPAHRGARAGGAGGGAQAQRLPAGAVGWGVGVGWVAGWGQRSGGGARLRPRGSGRGGRRPGCPARPPLLHALATARPHPHPLPPPRPHPTPQDVKPLLKDVCRKVFGGAGGLVDMVVRHVPSAKRATAEKVGGVLGLQGGGGLEGALQGGGCGGQGGLALVVGCGARGVETSPGFGAHPALACAASSLPSPVHPPSLPSLPPAPKVSRHYSGPLDPDSLLAKCMTEASPRGPLVFHVAKLFPKQDGRAFDALGRIISGTLRPGDRVSRGCGGVGVGGGGGEGEPAAPSTRWAASSAARCGRATGCAARGPAGVAGRGAGRQRAAPRTRCRASTQPPAHPLLPTPQKNRCASWARATPPRTRRTAPSRRSPTSGSTRCGGAGFFGVPWAQLLHGRGQLPGPCLPLTLCRRLQTPPLTPHPRHCPTPRTPNPPGALPAAHRQGDRGQPGAGGGARRGRGQDGHRHPRGL